MSASSVLLRAPRRRALAAPLLVAALVAAAAPPAGAASIAERTVRVSIAADGGDANGVSTRPSISGDGNVVVFDSTASNLTSDPNGAVRDVFARDLRKGTTQRLSVATVGDAADGESRAAAIARESGLVAFESLATNLAGSDTNGVSDVYITSLQGGMLRASVAHNGEQADGPSFAPDISADGRFVVFASAATNLVPGDANGRLDVFVRDLVANTTRILSSPSGQVIDGESSAPAISQDGRYVSFYSTTSNLVFDDGNEVGDVFVFDLRTNRITRVSTDRFGEEQNRAVTAPFAQISDISRDGRHVAFDSDATNLVDGDRNRDTDVFFHTRARRVTNRVSLDLYAREGSNDSFYPRLTPDGRYVAFQSFAANFSADDAPREDIFVYDRTLGLPTLVNVGATGRRRGAETVPQLLQRPDISDDGNTVAFTSTAGNLSNRDANGAEDVFIRRLDAPRGRIVSPKRLADSRRPRYELRADDPRATRFVCILDRRARFPCNRSGRLPRLSPGVHHLAVRAGGPGMHYQETKLASRAFFIPARAR